MSKPIQDGGELHESEEGDGEFVIAGCHAAEAFESGEEIFDPVAATVVAAMEGHGLAAAAQPSNADPRLLPVKLRPEATRIEAFVANDAFTAKRGPQRLNGFEVMAIARGQAQRHSPSVGVHDGRQLGVDPALTATNRLLDLAPARIGAMVMHLDVRTIDVSQLTARSARQPRQQLGPQSTRTPSPPAGVDRAPRPELAWYIAPRTARSQYIPDGRDHESIILPRSAATVPICQRRLLRPLTLIFLAEPTAAPAAPSVM